MDKENLKVLILTLKGVVPANYQSMERLVTSVQYLESVLIEMEKDQKGEATDG